MIRIFELLQSKNTKAAMVDEASSATSYPGEARLYLRRGGNVYDRRARRDRLRVRHINTQSIYLSMVS